MPRHVTPIAPPQWLCVLRNVQIDSQVLGHHQAGRQAGRGRHTAGAAGASSWLMMPRGYFPVK